MKKMTRDEILKIINEIMDDYQLGSDNQKMFIDNVESRNELVFCSVMYDWYRMKLKDDTPEELLKGIITLLMDYIFEIDEYKEKKEHFRINKDVQEYLFGKYIR